MVYCSARLELDIFILKHNAIKTDIFVSVSAWKRSHLTKWQQQYHRRNNNKSHGNDKKKQAHEQSTPQHSNRTNIKIIWSRRCFFFILPFHTHCDSSKSVFVRYGFFSVSLSMCRFYSLDKHTKRNTNKTSFCLFLSLFMPKMCCSFLFFLQIYINLLLFFFLHLIPSLFFYFQINFITW